MQYTQLTYHVKTVLCIRYGVTLAPVSGYSAANDQIFGGEMEWDLAKAPAQAVYGKRLRDQVYDLIKDDLKAGSFNASHRLYEVELAEKYGVSRTPVREALFQLLRDGLIVSEERGYTLPVDTPKKFADRIEVHILIDPRVAFYAANSGDTERVKALRKSYERAQRAHASGRFGAYVDAVHQFRIDIRQMCDNEPLRRCSLLIEDQFLSARNALFSNEKYREMDLHHNAIILAAIERGDAEAAENATRDYMIAVGKLATDQTAAGEAELPKQQRKPRTARKAAAT